MNGRKYIIVGYGWKPSGISYIFSQCLRLLFWPKKHRKKSELEDYTHRALREKKQALQAAEMFFDLCAPEDFELANLRITVLNAEIRKLNQSIREAVKQNA